MKHVVFLGDGMADEPFAPLGGHTPLELARHPGMDFLASQGEFGLTRTVPSGMPAGSDTANLSVLATIRKSIIPADRRLKRPAWASLSRRRM